MGIGLLPKQLDSARQAAQAQRETAKVLEKKKKEQKNPAKR